ncbi:MAG: TetR/AcrR family transcriptional regulator [Ignavibacteriaceae bacterium]|jgi:AcrR family transcriptional regulator|nr:TetR/AcrR family transcriptional regulator [Ignavibacteriaceae bacterium]
MKPKKLNIIKAAEKRFTRHGVKKTTLNEIARDLRLAKPSLYHYFKSKEALWFAVLDNQINEFIAAIKEIFENTSLSHEEKITAYLKEKASFPTRFSLIFALFENIFKPFPLEEEITVIRKLLEKEENALARYFESRGKGKKGEVPGELKSFVRLGHAVGLVELIENKLLSVETPSTLESAITLLQYRLTAEPPPENN